VKPVKSDDAPDAKQDPLVSAETISGSSMSGLSGRHFPCYGTGSDGPRIRTIYVYPAGGTNRISSLRGGFNAIASRMNGIMYDSGYTSGDAHQIRFYTDNGNSGCNLDIGVAGIGGNLNDYNAVASALKARGYDNANRKYMVWIDGGTACGRGQLRPDSSPGQTNANNTSMTYSWIWKPCWNYAEMHELTHMLGAVQPDAPYATNGWHCRDDNDVMCYNDGLLKSGTSYLKDRCPSTLSNWRLDCGDDTYFRGAAASSGYLSNHWNTSNSQFLTR
jgi:hypothetical protein